MLIKKKLSIPIYSMYLTIVLNKDCEFKHEGYPQEYNNRVGCVLNSEEQVMIVLNCYDYSSIVHECVHVAQAICEFTCISDDESEAYLTQWAFEKVCELIEKNKLTFE